MQLNYSAQIGAKCGVMTFKLQAILIPQGSGNASADDVNYINFLT